MIDDDFRKLAATEFDVYRKLKYCYEQLLNSETFKNDISWHTEIVDKLTMLELIGAIVHATVYFEENVE
jgi:hypothetical protein